MEKMPDRNELRSLVQYVQATEVFISKNSVRIQFENKFGFLKREDRVFHQVVFYLRYTRDLLKI